MTPIFFYHLSIDGHLGYFCTLPVVNKITSVNVDLWIQVGILLPLGERCQYDFFKIGPEYSLIFLHCCLRIDSLPLWLEIANVT